MRSAVIVLIVLGGFVQYSLMYLAMKDLIHRPRVRGDNKVAWALVVLCVPIAGALAYDWNGKTGFRTRAGATTANAASRRPTRTETVDWLPTLPDIAPATPPGNITSIRTARSYREREATVIPLRSGPRPMPIRQTFAGPTSPRSTASEAASRSIPRPTGS